MIIYYFSGTGNSFVVAHDIAQNVGGKLVPIPDIVTKQHIDMDTARIGIVFPSYLAPVTGVPLIVERFVRRITNIQSIRIFAICTCGGYAWVNAIPSLMKLQAIVKECGGKLHAMYAVRLPMNNLDYAHIPIPINQNHETIIQRSDVKLKAICNRITSEKSTEFALIKTLFFYLMKPLYALMKNAVMKALKEKAKEPGDSNLNAHALIPRTDQSIVVDDHCIGCGTCASVCPVSNIAIMNERPAFQHRCEMCFACDEWCPLDALHHWSRAKGVKYHHPRIETPVYQRANQGLS